jgi:putative transposase
MDDYESLSHTTWTCKYHVVFIPKCRRKRLYLEPRRHLGEVFRKLAVQKESKVEEGHLMPDHVHMLLSIPPKYAVSQVVGFIKGKSAIHLARVYGERKRNFVGQHFWARGLFVTTVGRDEEGSEARADEPLARPCRLWAAPSLTGRVSDPSYRFERFTS